MSSTSERARAAVRQPNCPTCGRPSDRTKPRSLDQHRRYFALIKAAFDQWPEEHEHQFASPEELRKWLQMKAGHREVGASIPLTGIQKERAKLLAEAAIRASGSYAVPVIHGNTLVVFRPKSIAFESLDHKAACTLFDEVAAFIEDAIGVPADQLLREKAV